LEGTRAALWDGLLAEQRHRSRCRPLVTGLRETASAAHPQELARVSETSVHGLRVAGPVGGPLRCGRLGAASEPGLVLDGLEDGERCPRVVEWVPRPGRAVAA
jgi:hypothetical protein